MVVESVNDIRLHTQYDTQYWRFCD